MADKNEWKNRIIEACKEAGTYQECFGYVIDTLAEIMQNHDQAQEAFDESGGQTIVRTEYRGAEVIKKNPALTIILDLNAQALAYWRDLGLTPAGLKRLRDSIGGPDEKGKSALEAALEKLAK